MKKGDFVRISYVGRLESGEIFDLTDEELAKKEKILNPNIRYGPAAVIVGAGFVIPGLENYLTEMKVGEKKTVTVEPEQAFGQRDPKLVRTVPETAFGKQRPIPGMIVDFGQQKGRVQAVSAGRVRVDFNHPLAGKKLNYEIEIKDQIKDAKDQVRGVLDFFGVLGEVKLEGNTVEIETELVPQLKQRIADLIASYVKGIENIRFFQLYKKQEKKEEQEDGKEASS